MRKKRYVKNVAVMLSDETYQKLVEITDEKETTISKFIREIVETKINQEGDNEDEK